MSTITLPFDTPTANVLRFIIIEYVILKVFVFATEVVAFRTATTRAKAGELVSFREGWSTFFLVPYRLRETSSGRRIIPWLLVFVCNAFLLAIEFGFDSVTQSTFPAPQGQIQDMARNNLGPSQAVDRVSEVRWITRATLLSQECSSVQNFTVYASDGFISGALLTDDKYEVTANMVMCGDDSRIQTKMPKMNFFLSSSGLEGPEEPFSHATADLTIVRTGEKIFVFQGGDTDLHVSGALDLSRENPGDEDYVFDVTGSCSGFGGTEDPIVYCYLSDGGKNRFIVVGMLRGENSSPIELGNVRQDDKVEIPDSTAAFRAEVFDGEAKDGDHLAAIKTLVVNFQIPNDVVPDPATLVLLYPSVIRTFLIATMYGATSLQERSIVIEDTSIPESTERAQVTTWALILLCCMIILPVLLCVWLRFGRKQERVWNIPVRFNALAQMAMDQCRESATHGEVILNGSVTCGLIDSPGGATYKPVPNAATEIEKEAFDDVENSERSPTPSYTRGDIEPHPPSHLQVLKRFFP